MTNTNLTELLEPLVGQKVLTSWIVKDFIDNPSLPYKKEVEEEVEGIKNTEEFNLRTGKSTSSRSYMQIHDTSTKGKIAEVILREDENVGPLFEHADKRFHDLYFRAGKCFVEVKRWKKRDIKSNIQHFMTKDAVTYNTSRWLVIFTYDDNYTWLDQVVDLQNVKPFIFEINLRGKTFTIPDAILKQLEAQNDAVIKFNDDDVTYVLSLEWFINNMQESFSGRHKGGWFVYADKVRAAAPLF